ncbi:MAG: hypothetical protein ACOCRO_01820 [Halanaerobiales bacterium]
MKFNDAINEGVTTPAAMKLVRMAIKELGKDTNKKKIMDYIKNNLVKNKSHYDSNIEAIEAAIDGHKKGQL